MCWYWTQFRVSQERKSARRSIILWMYYVSDASIMSTFTLSGITYLWRNSLRKWVAYVHNADVCICWRVLSRNQQGFIKISKPWQHSTKIQRTGYILVVIIPKLISLQGFQSHNCPVTYFVICTVNHSMIGSID